MVPRAVSEDTVIPSSLCGPFVAELGVSGASVAVAVYRSRQATVCASDGLAARIDSLQFGLGEGPHWDALATRAPVLCEDLLRPSHGSWPIFLHAVRAFGVGSLFSFPMIMGAALVGVVDLYSFEPRKADRDFVAKASLMAGRVASGAVHAALHSAENHDSLESRMAPALRREVHQATGLIAAQLDVTVSEAFSRLQAHAFGRGTSIDDIAHEVVARTLRFDHIPE